VLAQTMVGLLVPKQPQRESRPRLVEDPPSQKTAARQVTSPDLKDKSILPRINLLNLARFDLGIVTYARS